MRTHDHHDRHHQHHHDDRGGRGGSGERGWGRGFGRMPGGPFGPGGFGPFAGFGPGGGSGPGGRGRGGPRARRGDIRSAVLGVLAEQPSNGYGLIGAVSERTDGAWTPSSGSVYPTLAQLVDEGLIAQAEGPRGPYALTDAGRAHVAEHGEAIAAAFDNARAGGAEDEIGGALRKLLLATAPFKAETTAEQRTAAVAAIDAARRELHRILAE